MTPNVRRPARRNRPPTPRILRALALHILAPRVLVLRARRTPPPRPTTAVLTPSCGTTWAVRAPPTRTARRPATFRGWVRSSRVAPRPAPRMAQCTVVCPRAAADLRTPTAMPRSLRRFLRVRKSRPRTPVRPLRCVTTRPAPSRTHAATVPAVAIPALPILLSRAIAPAISLAASRAPPARTSPVASPAAARVVSVVAPSPAAATPAVKTSRTRTRTSPRYPQGNHDAP